MPPPLGKNNKLRSAEMAAIAASLFGMVATAQAETPDDLPSTEDTPGAMPPPEPEDTDTAPPEAPPPSEATPPEILPEPEDTDTPPEDTGGLISKRVSRISIEVENPDDIIHTAILGTTTTYCFLRETPSSETDPSQPNNTTLATLDPDTEVIIIQQQPPWYNVVIADGTTGYIYSTFMPNLNVTDIPLLAIKASVNYDIDPYLIMSLLGTADDNDELFLAVLEGETLDFRERLELAIRNIKEHEITYKNLSDREPIENGLYTAEFLAYFSEIHAPSAQNTQHFHDLQEAYSGYRGQDIPDDIEEVTAMGRKLANLYRMGLSFSSQQPVTPEQIALILGEDVIQPRELVPEMTRMTSNFGVRISPIDHVRKMHTGIDISAPTGTPVNAWRDGTVVFASRRGGYGNMVAIRHADGSESYYAHLHGLSVIEGDIVEEGTQIGTVGNTGDSTGPHLHFEIRIKRRPINPLANADRHHQVSQTP